MDMDNIEFLIETKDALLSIYQLFFLEAVSKFVGRQLKVFLPTSNVYMQKQNYQLIPLITI